MQRFLMLLLVGFACFVLGSATLGPRARVAHGESVAAAWSASLSERATWQGIEAEWKKVDDAVAPILSQNDPIRLRDGRTLLGVRSQVLALVAERARVIDKTREEFFAQKRLERKLEPGVLLTFDGVSWTTTSSKE